MSTGTPRADIFVKYEEETDGKLIASGTISQGSPARISGLLFEYPVNALRSSWENRHCSGAEFCMIFVCKQQIVTRMNIQNAGTAPVS
jgi:hypothetical protein